MKSRCSCLSAFLLLLATAATAETFVVNKEADDNGLCTPDDCSFREAILAANANPGFDTIQVPAGTYPVEISGTGLDEGSFDVLGTVEILGVPGRTFLVGDGQAPVLFLAADDGPVTLVGLDISGGYNVQSGGGIRSSITDLIVEDCSIHDNRSESDGGGIAALASDLRLSHSAVFENTAGLEGGGVFGFGFSTAVARLEIVNSTISGNHALQGGGVGAFAETPVHLRNTTITGNTASFRSSAFSTDNAPPARFTNTLIVGTCGQNQRPTSGGGNIESPGETCLFFDDPTDRMGVADPGLGPLGDYGGPTRTHALLAGSPAIDTAVGPCEPIDQRGTERPADGDGDGVATCDVGAFEYLPVPSVVEVPVVTREGLAILGLLLAAAGFTVSRRRG